MTSCIRLWEQWLYMRPRWVETEFVTKLNPRILPWKFTAHVADNLNVNVYVKTYTGEAQVLGF